MKRKMRNRHGVPRTLQLAYFGRNMHFIRNWLRQVIDTSHLKSCCKKILTLLERAAFQNALM